MFLPISPPSASISRTRCPLELPPILGLQGMRATLSMLTVNIIVSNPRRAAARAASHPACPAPTIMMSYVSSTFIRIVLPKSASSHVMHSIILIYCEY